MADDAKPATGTSADTNQAVVPADQKGTPNVNAAPNDGTPLPPARSDHDEQPPVASPGIPGGGGIVRQAGVGGVVGYGRAGVLELGGSAGFQVASDFRSMNLSPTIGWFLADNLELSAILSIANVKTNEQSATLWSALAEPSYHVPFNRSIFGFLGLGIGASYVSQLGTGLAVAPRLGMNMMVGRSGVLTPSISYQYTSHNSMTNANQVTLVEVSSSTRFNVGYTAMW